MPNTTATGLTADAATVRDATAAAANTHVYDGRQRFVPLLHLRSVVDLPDWRFGQAVVELAASYQGWLRVDWESTAADDAASARHRGFDYHLLSVDDWRGTPAGVAVRPGGAQ
jgi:hypothetical protein